MGRSAGIHGRSRTPPGCEVEPAQFVVVLQRPGFSLRELREPDPHGRLRVKRPARGGFRGQLRPEPHQHAQFFLELAVQGVLGGLAWSDFSARELPHSGKLRRRRTPRHRSMPGCRQGVHYCAANDVYESSHALKSKAGAGSGAAGGRGQGASASGRRTDRGRRPPRHLRGILGAPSRFFKSIFICRSIRSLPEISRKDE